jgi:hypothetical protein
VKFSFFSAMRIFRFPLSPSSDLEITSEQYALEPPIHDLFYVHSELSGTNVNPAGSSRPTPTTGRTLPSSGPWTLPRRTDTSGELSRTSSTTLVGESAGPGSRRRGRAGKEERGLCVRGPAWHGGWKRGRGGHGRRGEINWGREARTEQERSRTHDQARFALHLVVLLCQNDVFLTFLFLPRPQRCPLGHRCLPRPLPIQDPTGDFHRHRGSLDRFVRLLRKEGHLEHRQRPPHRTMPRRYHRLQHRGEDRGPRFARPNFG